MKKETHHKNKISNVTNRKRVKKVLRSRPRNYVDGMHQAAGMLKQPVSVVQAAKESGCGAFRNGGRIHLDQLRTWLHENPELVARAIRINEAEERQQVAEAELAEHRVQLARGDVIHAEKVKRDVTRHGLKFKFKFLALPKQLATRFALETDAVTIEQQFESEVKKILAEMNKHEWGAFHCPHCKKQIDIST